MSKKKSKKKQQKKNNEKGSNTQDFNPLGVYAGLIKKDVPEENGEDF